MRERRGIRSRAFFKSTSTVCIRGEAGQEQFSPDERWEHRREQDFEDGSAEFELGESLWGGGERGLEYPPGKRRVFPRKFAVNSLLSGEFASRLSAKPR